MVTKAEALNALNALDPKSDVIDQLIANITSLDNDTVLPDNILAKYEAATKTAEVPLDAGEREREGNGNGEDDGEGEREGDGTPLGGDVPPVDDFTTTDDGYKIKKDDSIKNKVNNATDAYRVQKDNNEYLVFKGPVNIMIGGQKKSKSQKRGGKKQRQTKRKMGGRRRSNRRR